MKTILSLTTTLLFVAMLAAGRAEPTIGEAAFHKRLGRNLPTVKLWPEGKAPDEPKAIDDETAGPHKDLPDTLVVRNVTEPSFVVIAPTKEKQNGAAILLCPGGGYGLLGFHTVHETADWMNARGITVVLLKYRVPKRQQGYEIHHHPLQDAQRAMGILRKRAAEWGIHPDKIGIGGFSAGGNLAALLSNTHEKRTYEPLDAFDAISCRPNFAVLLYPAYLTDPIESLTPSEHLTLDGLSSQRTPPTFTAITMPDKFTIGSAVYYRALQKAKINSELHVYHEGGHGGAIAKKPFGEWAGECLRWMGDIGIVPAGKRAEPFTYKTAGLPEEEPDEGLTPGDQRLRQIFGADLPVIPVWPTGTGPDEPKAVGAEEVTDIGGNTKSLKLGKVSHPTLTLVKPKKMKSKRSVIICPGGGYHILAAELEGTKVADWLNDNGMTGILLKYRVPRRGGEYEKHHHALQDLQRSIRIVRSSADEWGLDPNQIGILGFSAGGHLCAAASTMWQENQYAPIDEIDKVSAKPDFSLLIYPAYLNQNNEDWIVDPLMAPGLKRNQTPPIFMTIARDDSRFIPGVLAFLLGAREAKVPTELHIYHGGGHGTGLDPAKYPMSEWPKAAMRWMGELE